MQAATGSANWESAIDQGLAALEAGQPDEALVLLEQASNVAPDVGQIWMLRGKLLNRLDRYQEALPLLDKATELDPKDGRGWFQKATALFHLEQHAESLQALDQALRCDPTVAGQFDFQLMRGYALSGLERFNDALAALELAEPLAAGEIEHAAVWFGQGVALNGVKKYQEALRVLDQAEPFFAEGPRGGLLFFQQGIALNALAQPQAALDALARAEPFFAGNLSPLIPVLHFHQGVAHNSLGKPDDALAFLSRALEGSSEASPLAVLRPGIQTQMVRAWAIKATMLQREGRQEETLQAMEEALRLNPDLDSDLQFWSQRVGVLLALGRAAEVATEPPEALRDHPFTLAVRASAESLLGRMKEMTNLAERASDPKGDHASQPLAWVGAGLANMALFRLKDAVDALDKACGLDPGFQEHVLVRGLRGFALAMLGRHDEAIQALDGLPDSEFVLAAKGIALAGKGEKEKALQTFDQTLDQARKSPRAEDLWSASAWSQKGFLLLSMERNEEALDAFQKAVAHADRLPEANPNRCGALLGKGLLEWKLQQKDDALTSVSEGARLSAFLPEKFPQRGAAWWAKGLVLESMDRDEEALEAFQRAEQLEPASARILLSKGEALLTLQDYEKAEKVCSQAAAAADEDEEKFDALVSRGRALRSLEHFDDAVAAYRQAVALDPARFRNEWRLWAGLGETYRLMHRFEVARRTLDHGWKRTPKRKRPTELAVAFAAVLLDQKRDQEALDFLNKTAPETKPDARFEYNRGLACFRLKQTALAREHWKKAAELGLASAEENLRQLDRRAGDSWIDYWFGEMPAMYRKVTGAMLLLAVMLISMLPLVRKEAISWLNTGQDWNVMVVALVPLLLMLLLPTLRGLSFGLGPLKLEPSPAGPEFRMASEAGVELLQANLQAIGPSLMISAYRP